MDFGEYTAMPHRYVAPSLTDSFSCPHCGALSHQSWLQAYVHGRKRDNFPWDPDDIREDIEEFIDDHRDFDPDKKATTKRFFQLLKTKEPFFPPEKDEGYCGRLENVDFSQCFSCKRFAIWVAGKIIYPSFTHDVTPNDDLPDDIKVDFREAQAIVNASPRGSAALLRLCIQKLCKHLGEKGKNINDDVGELVKKGLDSKIQKALDVVRVIGNEAVHPGQIDLKDDLETVNKLFVLVNLIADALITQPKMVDGLFNGIPETKRAEIAKRDK